MHISSVATETPVRPERTYAQILKSSFLLGCSSAATIAIGIARAKVMAVLLGPAGVGLAGLYSSTVDVTSTIAGLGVNSSGVRQIAAAVGSGDTHVIGRTTVVLRRVSIALGVLGAVALLAFSGQVSALTFGSSKYRASVCLLSIGIFFKLVSAGQAALIQGMRRISDLAKMAAWSALLGAAITVIVVFFLRDKGIVPSLICGAAISSFISWRYSRRIRIARPVMPASEVAQEVAGLLKLGTAFMITGLMTIGSAYVIRIIILRHVGFEGAGLYQSAWTLGAIYVGFILQAMGADFYPRLTAAAEDNGACNRMVNEQAHIGLLLGGPGVLGTLTFAPLVLAIFYSAKFHGAVELFRWLCLGTILQVISWPMGFIILAKGRQNVFMLSDLAWTVVYVGLAWVCVRIFGLNGAGIAFFASYVFHGLMTYPIVRRLSGFRWTAESQKTGLFFCSLIGVVFGAFYALPFVWAVFTGILGLCAGGMYSLRVLRTLIPLDRAHPLRAVLFPFKRRSAAQADAS